MTTTTMPHPETSTPARVELPAALLMALHCSALEEGGIGGGAYWTPGSGFACPLCFTGHIWSIIPLSGTDVVIRGFGDRLPPSLGGDPFTRVLRMNDRVVRAINARNGEPNLDARVAFEEWIAECEAQCNLAIIPIDDDQDPRLEDPRP